MINTLAAALRGKLRPSLVLFAVGLFLAPLARAGLTLQLDLIDNASAGVFTCSPNLSLNEIGADATPVTFHQIRSPDGSFIGDFPGNSNDFRASIYDFNTFTQALTNGLWTLIMNVGATNEHTYHFTVTTTSDLTSNVFGDVGVDFPADGATNAPSLPNFVWHGPADWDSLFIEVYNLSFSVFQFKYETPTVTTDTVPPALPPGSYVFGVDYTVDASDLIASSTPLDASSQAAPGWVSTGQLDHGKGINFTAVAGTSPVTNAYFDPTLVAYYTFDDFTNPGADISGYGNNLNYTNNWNGGSIASTTNAIAGGGALQFDNNNYNGGGILSGNPTPTNLLAALAGSFSVAAWIRTSDHFDSDGDYAFRGEGIVAASIPYGSFNDVIPLALVGGGIGFNTGTSGAYDDTLSSQRDINDGNYHQVVVTRSQPTGLKLIYIDGALDSDPNNPDYDTTNLLNDPELLTIGAFGDASQPDPDPGVANYYNGYRGLLDDLQIYSRVLTSNEITYLYQNPGSALTNTSLTGITNVVHYTFDNTNNPYHDDSGNGNDIVSETTFGGGYPAPDPAGISGGGLFFSGSNWSTLPTSLLATLAGDFSVSVWLKTTQVTGEDNDDAPPAAGIVWANTYGEVNDCIPMALTGHKLGFFTGNPDTTLHSTNNIDTGAYVFLTVTRRQDTAERKIYVNGVLDSSDLLVGGTQSLNDSTNLYLGVNADVYVGVRGTMDDFQMYQGVLSAAQVAYLYAHPGLVVYNTTVLGGTVKLLNPALVGGNFQFSFQSLANRTNSVQYSLNLAPGSWQTFSNISGDGSLKTISIPTNSAATKFFRVSVQ